MKLEFSRQIFEKYSNIKFHVNPSSGSLIVRYGQTDGQTERRTDMTKLIVAFRNFANTPQTNVTNAIHYTRQSVSLFVTYLYNTYCQSNVFHHKFSNLLWCSPSALSGKVLQDFFFNLECLRRQYNTMSHRICCPRTAGSAGLAENMNFT